MKTKQKTIRFMAAVLVFSGLMALPIAACAGSLEPSAPPGPTMKTLDEVEPRIPIQSLSGSANAMYVVNQPGSYYLTGDVNVVATDKNGINVEVNDVTIDLMGYTLKGPDSGNKSGIYMNGRSNVEVRNGTVRDFAWLGIYDAGIGVGKGHRVIGVRVVSNGDYGILLYGASHLVKDCTSAENQGCGIDVRTGSTVTGNTVHNNLYQGTYTGYGCTVTGNTCYDNGCEGIYAYYGSTVTGNTCYKNGYDGIYVVNGTVTGNTVYDNNDCGVWASSGCTVTGNTARSNNQDDTADYAGIRVYSDCLVKGNTMVDNKQNNIYVYGDDNAIEENLVTDSTNGVCFSVTGNFYANNRASGNTYDYNDVPGTNTDGGGNVSF